MNPIAATTTYLIGGLLSGGTNSLSGTPIMDALLSVLQFGALVIFVVGIYMLFKHHRSGQTGKGVGIAVVAMICAFVFGAATSALTGASTVGGKIFSTIVNSI